MPSGQGGRRPKAPWSPSNELPPESLVGAPRIQRNILGEEPGEMRRQRPVRPRVILNRDAVWALLDQLGISWNELARRCPLSHPGRVQTPVRSSPGPGPDRLRFRQND